MPAKRLAKANAKEDTKLVTASAFAKSGEPSPSKRHDKL